METDEDRRYQETQEALLTKVSLSFPHMGTTGNPGASTPISMPVPISASILGGASTSSLPEDADQRIKMRLEELRKPAEEEKLVNKEASTPFSFDTPASMTLPYPGLDGHPRRIVPTPISIPISPIRTPTEIYQSFREHDARNQKEVWA